MKKYTIVYMTQSKTTALKCIECVEGRLFDHLATIGIDASQLWAVLEGHTKAIDTDWSLL